jgi:hypothetical protein
VIGLILFGQNHLYVKMLFSRDSAIQKSFRRFCKLEKSILCQSSERLVILSGRSYVHCSIRPDDVPYRLDARQTKHHSSERRGFPSGPSTVSRSFCSSLHPSRRLSSPSGRLSVFDQASGSFQVHIWKDCCNLPNDVDSCLDALLLKTRVAIQIQPSRRLSIWSGRAFNRYENCRFNFNRPDAYISWSGRALNRYENCVLKINRPDGHPPWFRRAKPYMEITCSGRATVRTRLSNRKDFQLKSQKF